MGLKEQISSGSPSTLRAGTGFLPSSPRSSLSTLSPLKFFDPSKSTSAQNPFSADTLDKARCAINRYNLLPDLLLYHTNDVIGVLCSKAINPSAPLPEHPGSIS